MFFLCTFGELILLYMYILGLDVVGASRTRMEGRVDKRSTRRFSSHHKHYDPSQDQVVPQADIRTNDKDERDLPNVAVAPPPMAPAS